MGGCTIVRGVDAYVPPYAKGVCVCNIRKNGRDWRQCELSRDTEKREKEGRGVAGGGVKAAAKGTGGTGRERQRMKGMEEAAARPGF